MFAENIKRDQRGKYRLYSNAPVDFSKTLKYKDLFLDTASRKVYQNGEELRMIEQHYRALETLILKQGEIVSYEDMIKAVYGENSSYQIDVVKTWVRNLRKILGGIVGKDIRSVWSVGYLLLREATEFSARIIHYMNRIRADVFNRKIWFDGELMNLSSDELDVFLILLQRIDKVFFNEEMLGIMGGTEFHMSPSQKIERAIRGIRRKAGWELGRKIEPFYGLGYRLEAEEISVENLGDQTVYLHGIVINPESYRVFYENNLVPLNLSEFKTLLLLVKNPERVFRREEITEWAYGKSANTPLKLVTDWIKGIRQKLPSLRHLIQTVNGVGYRMEGESVSVENIGDQAIVCHGKDGIVIDPHSRRIFVEGKIVSFDSLPKSFDLLFFMAKNPGKVLGYERIEDELCGEEEFLTRKAIDRLMFFIKKRIGRFGKSIEQISGVGYRLREEEIGVKNLSRQTIYRRNLAVDPESYRAFVGNKLILLGSRNFEILLLLAEREDLIVYPGSNR